MGGLASERIDGPLSGRRAGLRGAQDVRQIGENGKWAAELMCRHGQRLVLLPIGFFQLKSTLAQFAFHPALRRHVANCAGDQDACFGRQRAERDIDWKLVTVLAQAVKLEAAAIDDHDRVWGRFKESMEEPAGRTHGGFGSPFELEIPVSIRIASMSTSSIGF